MQTKISCLWWVFFRYGLCVRYTFLCGWLHLWIVCSTTCTYPLKSKRWCTLTTRLAHHDHEVGCGTIAHCVAFSLGLHGTGIREQLVHASSQKPTCVLILRNNNFFSSDWAMKCIILLGSVPFYRSTGSSGAYRADAYHSICICAWLWTHLASSLYIRFIDLSVSIQRNARFI